VRAGWGPTIPSTLGWVLMELPALTVFLGFFLAGRHLGDPAALALAALWTLHYANRSLVFPFRRRGGERPMPVSIAASALFFNLVNGYLQGRWLGSLGPELGRGWLVDPRFLGGVALFLAGFALNLHSDGILRRLRAPGETNYRLPVGGAFRWVSCPNYLGEVLEWLGWALATWSLPGAVFALWTVANLAPRALSNHRWLRGRFPDYPPQRRALLPFVL